MTSSRHSVELGWSKQGSDDLDSQKTSRISTNDLWQNARWETYCRNVDVVNIVLQEHSGRQIIATPMMRWKDGPDAATMKRLSKKLEVSLLIGLIKILFQTSGV